MPYDTTKTQELLRVAQAYSHTVTGDYIGQLAIQLLDADKEILSFSNTVANARREAQEADRKFVAESESHSATKLKLSEEIRILGEHKAAMMAAFESISADARGAKRIAAETIEKFNPKPAPTA